MVCKSPIREGTFENQVGEINCNKCEWCLKRIQKLWGLRVQAEALHSEFVYFLTLTYGGDIIADDGSRVKNPDAISANYDHIDSYVRALQNRGFRGGNFKCRYMIVPEFGELHGRLHWHAILFLTKRNPDKPTIYPAWECNADEVMGPYWPHGFTHALPLVGNEAYGKGAYIYKMALYAMKEQQADTLKMRRTKNPMIGWQLLAKKAADDARAGVYQDYFRMKEDMQHVDQQRRPRVSVTPMQPSQKKAYARFFIEAWRAKTGKDNWPNPRVNPASLPYKSKAEVDTERAAPDWMHPCDKLLDDKAKQEPPLALEQKRFMQQLHQQKPNWTPQKRPPITRFEGTAYENAFIEYDVLGLTYVRGYDEQGNLELERVLTNDDAIAHAKSKELTWKPRDYVAIPDAFERG